MRKTYGFNKKEDAIALSQFCAATGMKKPSVCRAIRHLAALNLIDKKDNGTITIYKINKDFETWKPLTKKITIDKKVNGHLQKSQSALTKKLHTKDNITKDNITKDKDIYSRVIKYLNEKAETHYKAGAKKTTEKINARLNEGYTLDDFIAVIDKKCQQWRGTEMEQYLRPCTLFGTKFEGYLNQKILKAGTTLSSGEETILKRLERHNLNLLESKNA